MLRVVFLATPKIAVNSVMKLLNFSDIHIAGIVTQPDRPAGRGKNVVEPPVKICALSHGIPVFQTESIKKDIELIQILKELKPDFFVTFAFGQLLSQEVLDIPKIATVNLHASLLPKYRGANPIQRAIYHGETETGITTMITVLGLDEGDICLYEKIFITENMTNLELVDIISDKAPFLIYRTLKGLAEKTLVPEPQNTCDISMAYKFAKKDAEIDWNKKAFEIHNHVRSMLDWPCACFKFQDKNIKIVETRLLPGSDTSGFTPGQVISVSKDGVEVKTGDSSILLTKIKPENKSVMSAFDWSNGAKLKAGNSFLSKENTK